jgi:hypothetical protein
LIDFEQNYRFELSVAVLVVMAVSMWSHARKGDIALVTISALLVSSTWVGMSYYYYQSFAIVVGALLLRDPGRLTARLGVLDKSSSGHGRISAFLIVAATSNTMFNLPIDSSLFGWYVGDDGSISEVTSISRTFTIPLWMLAIAVSNLGWRRRSVAVT